MRLSLLLALVSAPACSAVPRDTEPRAEIEYEVELATTPKLEVRFRLRVAAAEDGLTTVCVDRSWGCVEGEGDAILDLRASGPRGETLEVERASVNEWRVRSEPRARLDFGWRVAPNGNQIDTDSHDHFRTLFGENLLEFIGHLALLVPQHVPRSEKRPISMCWKGFAEAGWSVACSFGVDPRGFDLETSLDEIRSAVYLAAPDLRIHRRVVRGRPVAVAIAGSDWTFPDKRFVDDAAAIVETERAFFGDDDFPFYLVSLIPVGVPHPPPWSFAGVGLTRSCALFLQPDMPLASREQSDLVVQSLLAHEMFHHWTGKIPRPDEQEQLTYWFDEGFTVFYARRLLLRAGFGGLPEYARTLNETLREYALSPVRLAPNEKIREAFCSDYDVQRLAYQRGDLVAILLDGEIHARGGGSRSLDDFLRDTIARGRRGERLGTETLLHRIEEWTDAAFAARVRSIVVDGAEAAIDPSAFEPCLEITTESRPAFDLGFDFESSSKSKEVHGVRTGSAAARAGLADGQEIVGWNIAIGHPEEAVEIHVRENGARLAFRYLPQGDPVPVPQARPRPGAAPSDCAGL